MSRSDLRFKASAPPFLQRAYEYAVSLSPQPEQALRDQIFFFEASLRYLLYVLDAQRAAVGLPRKDAVSEAFGKELRVSLGSLITSVNEGVRVLADGPGRLAQLVEALNDPVLKEQLNALSRGRNLWSHLQLSAEVDRASEHVEAIRPATDCFTRALSCVGAELVVAVDTRTTTTTRTHLRRARDLHRFTVPGHVPEKRPFLLWPDGHGLSLFPGVFMHNREFELLWSRQNGSFQAVGERREVGACSAFDAFDANKVGPLFDEARRGCLVLDGIEPEEKDLEASPDRPSLPEEFEVLAKVGEGGLGAVWKARWKGRVVAVKVLHPSVAADGEARERLLREALALEKVAGGGVVPVLFAGHADSCGRFVVMEYLPGGDLACKAPMPAKGAAEITKTLLRTLYSVHGNGLIHRDIKPTNILLDGAGCPRLADFGIARDQSRATITQQERRLGTPAFWAPEQAEGKPVSPATDLFAVARVLGFLVTNETSREGHLAGLPSGLQAVYRRATEASPARRFQRAEDMLRALEDADAGSPVPVGFELSSRLVVLDEGESVQGCWLHAVQAGSGPRSVLLTPFNSAARSALGTAATKHERPLEKHDGVAFVEMPTRADGLRFFSGDSIDWNPATVAATAAGAAALGGLAVLTAGAAAAVFGNKERRAGVFKGLAAAAGIAAKNKKKQKVVAGPKPAASGTPYLDGFKVTSANAAVLRRDLSHLLLVRLAQSHVQGSLTMAQYDAMGKQGDQLVVQILLQTDRRLAVALKGRTLNKPTLNRLLAWTRKQLAEARACKLTPEALSPLIARSRDGRWCIVTPKGWVALFP
jgi:hypothetical protein